MDVFTTSTLQKITNSEILVSNDFQTNLRQKESKTIEFFKDLYTYPPKFKVIWNSLDELSTDTFLEENFSTLKHSLPFMDLIQVVTHRLVNSNSIHASETRYLAQDYIDGYINKSLSENFYKRKTSSIQNTLKNIPIYTILNGRGEVILAQTGNIYTNKNLFSEKLYDFCGAFDFRFSKNSGLGLFFLDQKDAEIYLKEIAQSDSFGTKMVGLSVHCIGLDSAYRITRNSNPNIEFRFIPNINEVKSLLHKQVHKGDFIFEDSQQQLRFRRRPVNIFPNIVTGVRTIEKYASPFSSFLQKSEYFKGVPIYLVQLRDTPRNFFVHQTINIFNVYDKAIGKAIKLINIPFGFGHSWIMQGSINSIQKSNDIQNYIFLNGSDALDFCKQNKRQVIRFSGNQFGFNKPLLNKLQIFVFNLEDFLELWEEKLKVDLYDNDSGKSVPSIFDVSNTYFIPDKTSSVSSISSRYLKKYSKPSLLVTSKEFLRVKFKTLQGFIGVFLNSN